MIVSMDQNNYFNNLKEQQKWDDEHYVLSSVRNFYHFVFWGIPNRIGDLKRGIKWGFQRIFRGYDDRAYWSLCSYLTEIILPVLKEYRKNKVGIPMLDGMENKTWEEQEAEWDKIVDKMICSFQIIYDDENCLEIDGTNYDAPDWFKKENETVKEGLELFAKYFRGLWN